MAGFRGWGGHGRMADGEIAQRVRCALLDENRASDLFSHVVDEARRDGMLMTPEVQQDILQELASQLAGGG